MADTIGLQPYRYTKLANKSTDIRLLSLLPGQPGDPLRLVIRHESLNVEDPERSQPDRLNLSHLRETLPTDWHAHENINGDYIFAQLRGDTWFTTNTHPDQSIHPRKYLPADQNIPPKYEALSYTWGSQHDATVAFIKTPPTSLKPYGATFTLPVRSNLAAALRQLRLRDNTRTLWVDAVCINQDDEPERNEQVRRMADIYTHASRAIIWLGCAQDESTCAMSTLEYIGKQLEVCNNLGWYLPAPGASEPGWFNFYTAKLPYTSDTWLAVEKLLDRQWFSRLWTIQESILASHLSIIQCGSYQMSWGRFRTAAAYLYSLHSRPAHIDHVTGTLYRVAAGTHNLSLSGVLLRCHDGGCADQRDKIYALLGLVPEPFRCQIQPQYSLPVPILYKEAFLAETRWSQRLEMLIICSMTHRQISGPTWVPDLSSTGLIPSSLQYQCSTGFSAAFATYDAPDMLTVQGVECARIKRVSSKCPESMLLSWDFACNWLGKDSEAPDFDDPSVQDAVVRVLCSDLTQQRHPNSAYPSLEQWKRFILHLDPTEPSSRLGERWVSAVDEIPRYLLRMCERRLSDRSLFVTEDGLLGLCPAATEPGDRVCVILGLNSCLMLRPTLNDTYQVVGECLLLAYQDSIGLLGPLPAPWRVAFPMINSVPRCVYVNDETGAYDFADPRLGPLDGWEALYTVPEGITTTDAVVYRSTVADEIRNSDPRLDPEALKRRGVRLRSFCLV